MTSSSAGDAGKEESLQNFYTRMRNWLVNDQYHLNSGAGGRRKTAAFYGNYITFLHTSSIVAELGANHTLDSLHDLLTSRLQAASTQQKQKEFHGELPAATLLEQIATFQGLQELLQAVQLLLRKQEYVYRKQIAGNPYWPHLLACVPALADYVKAQHKPDATARRTTGVPLSPTQKDMLRNFQKLLISGDDQGIYRFWQSNGSFLSRHISSIQQERVNLAEQRVQLLAEFQIAFRAQDAKQIHNLYQEMLQIGMASSIDPTDVNKLREAGRLIEQIERALSTGDENRIGDLYYQIRHSDAASMIPPALREELSNRYQWWRND